jgi:hypothetical protein
VSGEDKEVLAVDYMVLFVYAHEKNTGGGNLLKCFHLNNIFV